jgi:nitroreductase
MNEVLRAINDRFSCRDFEDTPLTTEQIQDLARAALASPSAMNLQPWQVIMVTDKALIDEMDAEGMNILAAAEDKTSYERMKSRGGKMFYNAPCMVIAASDGSQYAAMDCGILCQNVTLAAHSLGLGSVICAMVRIPLAGPRGEEWKTRLQFPVGYGFGLAVLAGQVKSGKEPHEKDMGKVTYIESAG